MSKKWIIASTLIVVLIILCGASLFAIWQGTRFMETSGLNFDIRTNAVKAEDIEENKLTVNGPVHLTLNNSFGNVSVTPGASGQVNIKAEKTAWGSNDADAQKQLESLKVIIEQSGNKVSISVEQSEEQYLLNFRPNASSVKFTITVPEETAVALNSTNGDLSLSGTTGDADLQTDFGRIEVSDVSGVVTAKTTNGNVTATNILSDKDVSLTSEFGNINAQEISATNLSVKTTNGTLDLQGIDASGAFKAGSDFGSISLSDGQASILEIESTNGKISLENVQVEGQVTLRDDFGDLTLNAVDASGYDLTTQNGKIMVDQARDSIKAQSDFGDVEILNVENGTIDLSSTNGAVTFSGSLAEGPHSVSSDFGNITLTLPAETALNVDLKTDFGKISSDFQIVVRGTLENNHWVGMFNNGGEELTVEASNGNITINSK